MAHRTPEDPPSPDYPDRERLYGVCDATLKARPAIRCLQAELVDFDRARVAIITVVAGRETPKIIMFNGDPFLIEENADVDRPRYFQERPFRADIGV